MIKIKFSMDDAALVGAEERNSTSLRRVRASVVLEAGIRWLTTAVRGWAWV
jgi:hypothetical protein